MKRLRINQIHQFAETGQFSDPDSLLICGRQTTYKKMGGIAMGEWKKTQCSMCVLSCGLEMEVENDHIINVRPDKDSPRSHGYCCRKGRSARLHVEGPERLNYPLKKVGDHFERISWNQAFLEIGERAGKIIEAHGPRSAAFVGGALPPAQSDMVFGRGLMAAIGSQYFYNAIGIEFMGSWWSHGKLFGDQMHYLEPDDNNSEVLVFWGSNSYVSGQILNARKVIRGASNSTKRTVVVVDPRLSETARMADLHIMPRAGTDALLLRAMIALILKNGWENEEYLARYARDLDKVRPWFDGFDIDGALRVCHVSRRQIEKLCRLLTTRKWGCHADLGLFMGRHNTLSCYLLLMLESICGVAFVPGGCIVPECSIDRGASTWDDDPKIWRTVETNRFPVLGTYPSGCLPQEILSTKEDHTRLVFCSASNPVLSYPDSNAVRKAFEKLDLLVVIDIAMTETAKMADYVLPEKSVYESYDINAFQYNYPEVVGMLRRPVITKQTGERMDGAWIIIGIMKAMGLMPDIPESLYAAAKKAADTGDRMPYFIKLLTFSVRRKVNMGILPVVVAETLGRYMDSPVEALLWAATLTSPIAGKGMVEAAGIRPSGKHKILEKLPVFGDLCLMDAAFQKVDDTPEGTVIGISDPNTMLERHLRHKDKKIHLYCDEIDRYIQRVTPEQEEKALTDDGEYPYALSAGRHSDDGVNWVMRNPKMNQYRNFYTVTINPEDGHALGIRDGENVRVITRTDSFVLPAEFSWQTSPGYVVVPHHYGYISGGKQYGETVNRLVSCQELDELTGNPTLRYVDCRIEKA